jgi:hypothetical protein
LIERILIERILIERILIEKNIDEFVEKWGKGKSL